MVLAAVGIKLPGIEYDIQKEEAGYRKELVLGEDDPIRAAPPTIGQLYSRVRGIHFKSYFHYLYFNTVKWSYFQGMVIVPYVALAPTIVTGAITLGFVQQITRALVICCTNPSVIAPVTMVGAKATYGTITIP